MIKISSPSAPARPAIWQTYAAFACLILAVNLLWYLCVWPGPLGPDGFSLVFNINNGVPRGTGKDPAWLLYGLATYGATSRIEALVIPLLIVHALIFSRIIGYIFLQGKPKTAALLLIFVACTPHILNYASSLYADSIFSLAFIGLLFELWLVIKNRRASRTNLAIILLLFPMAGFFKGNGIIIVLPLAYAAWHIKGRRGRAMAIGAAVWAVSIIGGGKILNLGHGHPALDPLVLFETTNFMQTKPMNLPVNRHMVTQKTKNLMYRFISQENIDKYYDRDYWDTIWHQNQDQQKFQGMTDGDRRTLRKEFFKYNVWRNIPAFVSSRVNIFLASALAQGGIVFPDDAAASLATVRTESTYNPLALKNSASAAETIFRASYDLRFILWTPFVGIALLLMCLRRSAARHDRAGIIICGTLLIQFAGIFMFSIAAEYRYLLSAFYSPLLLIPMLQAMKTRGELGP